MVIGCFRHIIYPIFIGYGAGDSHDVIRAIGVGGINDFKYRAVLAMSHDSATSEVGLPCHIARGIRSKVY